MNHIKELIEEQAKLHYATEPIMQTTFIKGANFALEMDRWVKVGEQTPKDYERVLASNGIYQVVCEYKHGCFWDELEQIRGIVIWQPLPNLPK